MGVELELQLLDTLDFDLAPRAAGPAARAGQAPRRLGREARDHAQHDRDRHLDPARACRRCATSCTTCAASCRAARASSTSASAAAARMPSSTGASSRSSRPSASTTSASCTATWPSSSRSSASTCTSACRSGDDALWLLHALSRYVPHFIALSRVVALRAGRGHRLPFGAAELGVRLPAVGARALRADLGRVRRATSTR